MNLEEKLKYLKELTEINDYMVGYYIEKEGYTKKEILKWRIGISEIEFHLCKEFNSVYHYYLDQFYSYHSFSYEGGIFVLDAMILKEKNFFEENLNDNLLEEHKNELINFLKNFSSNKTLVITMFSSENWKIKRALMENFQCLDESLKRDHDVLSMIANETSTFWEGYTETFCYIYPYIIEHFDIIVEVLKELQDESISISKKFIKMIMDKMEKDKDFARVLTEKCLKEINSLKKFYFEENGQKRYLFTISDKKTALEKLSQNLNNYLVLDSNLKFDDDVFNAIISNLSFSLDAEYIHFILQNQGKYSEEQLNKLLISTINKGKKESCYFESFWNLLMNGISKRDEFLKKLPLEARIDLIKLISINYKNISMYIPELLWEERFSLLTEEEKVMLNDFCKTIKIDFPIHGLLDDSIYACLIEKEWYSIETLPENIRSNPQMIALSREALRKVAFDISLADIDKYTTYDDKVDVFNQSVKIYSDDPSMYVYKWFETYSDKEAEIAIIIKYLDFLINYHKNVRFVVNQYFNKRAIQNITINGIPLKNIVLSVLPPEEKIYEDAINGSHSLTLTDEEIKKVEEIKQKIQSYHEKFMVIINEISSLFVELYNNEIEGNRDSRFSVILQSEMSKKEIRNFNKYIYLIRSAYRKECFEELSVLLRVYDLIKTFNIGPIGERYLTEEQIEQIRKETEDYGKGTTSGRKR